MKIKRKISFMLTVCLMAGIFSVLWNNVLTLQAASEESLVCFGVKGINNPNSENLTKDVAWSGDYVWFGHYGVNPIKWRILNKSGLKETGTSSMDGGMLLQSDTVLAEYHFEDGTDLNNEHQGGAISDTDWSASDIRAWLQGDQEFLNGFSAAERLLIISSTNEKGSDFNSYASAALLNDTVFLLDVADINNSKYGYCISDDGYDFTNTNLNYDTWWLRSSYLGFFGVTLNHHQLSQENLMNLAGLAPALNIKLDEIFLTSASETDFSSLISTKGINTGREWKLTLLDTDQSVSINASKEITRSDKDGRTTITVPYIYNENAGAKSANQISVMITDKDYTANNDATIKAYGRVSGNEGIDLNSEISFVLPEDYNADTDKVYLLSEQANGGRGTNYVSIPASVDIPTTYTIKFDPNGGSGQMQSVKAGVGENYILPDCGFTAPEGKEFKEWAIGSIDGTALNAGEGYTFTENTTVYAVWQDIKEEDTTEEDTTTEEDSTTEEDTTTGEDSTTEEDTTTGEESTTEEDTIIGEESTTEEDITTGEESTTEEDTTTGEESSAEEDSIAEEDSTTEEYDTTEEISTAEENPAEEDNTSGVEVTTEKDTENKEVTTEADTTAASDKGASVNTGDSLQMALFGMLFISAGIVLTASKRKKNE